MKTLITQQQIEARIKQLGETISRDYCNSSLTVVGVLSGCLMVMADLLRTIEVPLNTAFVSASSYQGTRTTPGELRINDSLLPQLCGRDILLLDDIFDTGHTMQELSDHLLRHDPASIRTAVLLWKPARNQTQAQPDYFGFQIPDEFVVGYGLDYNERFRELPFIAVPEPADLHDAEKG